MSLRKILLIGFLILVQGITFGQNTLNNAKKYRDDAKQNIKDKNYNLALVNIDKANTIAKSLDNNDLQAECLFIFGNIYYLENDDYSAIKYYLRAEELYRKLNDKEKLSTTYNQIGLLYFKSSSYRNSLDYFLKAINTNPKSNNKFDILDYIGYSYSYLQQYDSAVFYFNEMKKHAVDTKDTSNIIKSINNIILVNKKQNNYKKAIENNYLIYDIYSAKNDEKGQALTLNNIGYNYVLIGEYENAENAFKESLIHQKKANLPKETQANTNTNIGVCLQNQSKIKEAIVYLNNSANIWATLSNKKEKARIYNLIALIYYNTGDLHNASTYSEESVALAEQSGDVEVMQNCYQTYSTILQDGNDYQNALDYYKKYLKYRDSLLFEERVNQQSLNSKIQELEKIEKELKLKLAEEEIQNILLEQLKLEKEKIDKENELLRRDQELQKAELMQQQFALLVQKQQNEAILKQKEIEDLENAQKLKDVEIQKNKIETEKQQQAIALLQTEKENQQLVIDKNNARKNMFKWVAILVGFIMLLGIIFLLFTIRSNRNLNKQKIQILEQNTELNSQKEEIQSQRDQLQTVNAQITLHKDNLEQKHKQITDSITYASRIQNAMLPDFSSLGALFPNHFIFFKPKDIVSGDFYWTKQITLGRTPVLYVAAADCTGHGVPGAFVSMLGMSLLNEIVNKNYNLKANQILNLLRDEIKISLKQNEELNETKDGMDIALCIINKEEKTLQYAGAHNPLYLLRDKSNQISDEEIENIGQKRIRIFQEQKDKECQKCLIEIKADLQPIGIYIKERPFKNVELKLYDKDRIFLFSDGFIDQFGGKKNEKYQSVNFKRKIVEMQSIPISKHKDELEKEFNRWTTQPQKYEQLDDILIIGMEV